MAGESLVQMLEEIAVGLKSGDEEVYGWLREQLGDPEICETEEPALRLVAAGQQAACHFSEEIDPQRIADAATVVVPPAAEMAAA